MEAPCQCIKCRKRVSSLARLQLHNKLLHPEIIDHLCDYMDNATCYKLTRALLLQMFNQKTEQYKMKAPYQCVKCQKRVSSLTRLKLHNMLLHHDNIEHHLFDYTDNVSCNRLTTAFPFPMPNKILHQQTEQYKIKAPYQCIKCHKRVSSLAWLKLHNMLLHPCIG